MLVHKLLCSAAAVVALLTVGFACSESKTPDRDVQKGQTTGASDTYPLDVCVVSGEKLGAHGEPYDHKVDGRLVRLCCKACIDQLEAEPDKYLAKLDAAAKPNKAPAQ